MAYDVSSAFLAEVVKTGPGVSRKFYVGSDDYSDYVTKWPKIQRKWNDLKPKSISITVANQENDFSGFITNKTRLRDLCSVEMGIEVAVNSYEYVQAFTGTIRNLRFNKGGDMTFSIVDKLKPLSERIVGTDESPQIYSQDLVSDVAWDLLTTYGGLSSIESTSNPDINYSGFLSWAEIFSNDTVLIGSKFTGQKVTECIRSLGRMSASGIFEEDGKINFARYSVASVEPFSLEPGAVLSLDMQIADDSIVNKQHVKAAYSITSDYHTVEVFDTSTASVNSFNLREEVEDSDKIWYTTSATAQNFAQRQTSLYAEPYEDYTIKTALPLLGRAIGDTIAITYSQLGVADTFRLMGYNLDLQKLEFNAEIDATQLSAIFTLDDATNGLLDETYNPLG